MNYLMDFDGTICNSFDITIDILNEYLLKLHKKLIDKDEFRKIGIEEIIKQYKLSKLQILIYILKGRSELSKHINESKPYPDLVTVLSKLSKTNTVGIVSSNSKKNIEKFIELNNMNNIFKFVYSSPTLFDKSKKILSAIKNNNLNINESVYVGDEVRDINAAKKAGIKSVAVTWGFASENLLEKHNPDILINKPKELLLGLVQE
ncbi:HAD family hydrolase [soil metagenome]